MNPRSAGDIRIMRAYAIWTVVWGVVGMLVGIVIAAQLATPALNFANTPLGPYLTYGRLRPLHTNALIYGFGAGSFFCMQFYMVRRLCKVNLLSAGLARFQLWLWNITVVLAALSLLLGMNTSKEYHELEWPIDVLIVVIWVCFAINVIGTIYLRKEREMYTSLWYMIGALIGVAILFLGNGAVVPVSLFKSYPIYAGVNDANVQWWWGHNAVAFFFTFTPTAMIYYLLPKTTQAPIYSHRLSMFGFWGLMFFYLWTGAHHLILTPVPEWLQTVAIAFSLVLIAPSWATVFNTYMTMGGHWEKMRDNYLVKFIVTGVTFYGLQVIQGPLQAPRVFSQLIHYTDYVPGHVHMGTMGFYAMIIFAALYYVVPRLWQTELHSVALANTHFWLALVGQLTYNITMWIAGIQQGAMLKSMEPDGTLTYTFVETVTRIVPYWQMRTAGGVIFFVGVLIFTYNIAMTIRGSGKEIAAEEAYA